MSWLLAHPAVFVFFLVGVCSVLFSFGLMFYAAVLWTLGDDERDAEPESRPGCGDGRLLRFPSERRSSHGAGHR